MNVKRVKRKCMVRGCKNTDAYAVSLKREMGNSIIVCSDCAVKISKAIENETKSNISSAIDTVVPTEEDSATHNENIEENKYVCKICGRVCKNEFGLKSHEKSCKGTSDVE